MEACVNFPDWQSSVYIVTYRCQESNAVPTLWGKGQLEGLFGAFLPSVRALFSLTDLIFLHSKGLSRVFSNTTVQKHQFFLFCLIYDPTLTSTVSS